MTAPRTILTLLFIATTATCADPAAPPQVREQFAPEAVAGPDIMVPLPGNSAALRGFALDPDGNIVSYLWTKVSGPPSGRIENASLPRTIVTDLEAGWYDFELTVTDATGLTGRDTVGILVYNPTVSGVDLVFRDLAWQCPMGCTVEIPAMYSYFPPGTAIRVFVQEVGTDSWTQAEPEGSWTESTVYSWQIYNDGDLVVYTNDSDRPVNVKITF